MAKPIIVELRGDDAHTVKPAVKNVPQDLIYGSESKEGGTCRELMEYMLNPEPDEHNPEGYDPVQADFANRWNEIYTRSKNDVNIQIGLFGIPKTGTPIDLDLDGRVSEYVSQGDESILKTETLTDGPTPQKYNSIDLVIEDLSHGGYLAI